MAAHDVFGIVGTTQAGNFHVERVVAEGGFGVVYRAQHGAFRAPVAIKCLKIPAEMTKLERSAFLEKFREEAELMFRLSAAITEVVRPLHVDVLLLPDGRFVPFIALEWLDGESLDGIITRRRVQGQAPLGLHRVIKMLRPVAGALSRAHRFPGPHGAISIIHRDLKPENLFVASIGGSESMKILDFGIAKAKRAASQAAGRITGRTLHEDEAASFTPAYGAPEQWTPKTFGETGPWTDVWGLSLSMVEALCGVPVIDGDTYVMRRQCLDEKRRPTPRNHGADVSIEVDKVFERALAVDPRRRYKEVEAFWSELEAAMGLEQSFGHRDARREPGEADRKTPPIEPPKITGTSLARIELVKAPPSPSAEVPAARPKSTGLRGIGKPPTPSAPLPSKIADDDWSGVRPSDPGIDEPFAAKSRPQPAESTPCGADSSRGAARRPPPRVSEPGPAPPPLARQSSQDLEMPLPLREPSMPTIPAAHALTAVGAGASAAEGKPVGTEASVPSTPLALAGIDVDASAIAFEPAPQRTSSGGLELHLPSVDSAPPSPGPMRATHSPTPARSAAHASDPTFELGGVRQSTPASEVPPPMRGRPPMPARYMSPPPPPEGNLMVASLRARLARPLGIVLAALLVAATDNLYAKITGNPLAFGPVRPFWVAAPLAFVGVGFLLWRLMVHDDE